MLAKIGTMIHSASDALHNDLILDFGLVPGTQNNISGGLLGSYSHRWSKPLNLSP